MNQILLSNQKKEKYIRKRSFPLQYDVNQKHHLFRMQILFSLVIIVLSISSYFISFYHSHQNELLSAKIKDNYNISTLYSNTDHYIAKEISVNNDIFQIIGIIKIDKIKVDYPIFSEMNDDLLKIAPCRFHGPFPNNAGNICIAAHNYDNYKFFSRIKELEVGDIISIYDLSGSFVNYTVYINYETDINDTALALQNTQTREVTLVTCNNYNNKRVIVKAKEEM